LSGWVLLLFAAFHAAIGLLMLGAVAWLMLGGEDGGEMDGGEDGGGGGGTPRRPWRPRPPTRKLRRRDVRRATEFRPRGRVGRTARTLR
jgi:hypothetical protein